MSSGDYPNVVLVVLDTARADAFEPYGAKVGSTPAVAQLASRGKAHRRVYATCNWTMPSHVSMFTGLLPRTAGLSALPDGNQSNCHVVLQSLADRLLPAVLRRAGYYTAGASTNLWVSSRIGFSTGFDEFSDLIGQRVRRMHDSRLRARLIWYTQALLANVDDGLTAVDGQVSKWLDGATETTPFFWFINLIECHSPYLPPLPYNDLGPLARLRSARDARQHQTLTGVWKACATGDIPSSDALERMRHLYARAVRMMDDWLARLCERLDRQGLLDDTLIVVTSDHGENFGEGDLIGHAVSFDDRLLRVPLIFAGPDSFVKSDEVSSLAMLPSMIADAIGLEDRPWSDGDIPAGPAVAQYDTGIDPKHPNSKIFWEWGATDEGFRRFTEPGTCATDGRHKLILLGNEEYLYDLDADPLETNPLPVQMSDPAVLGRLRTAISDAGSREWTPDIDSLKRGERSELDASELKDLEDRMRLLGYL